MVRSVKIGAIDYAVEYVADLRDDGRKLDGYIEYNAAKICIETNMSVQLKAQSLLHEILHGISIQAGRQSELKEPMIETLAYGIYQVFKDNPDLVAMITKKGS